MTSGREQRECGLRARLERLVGAGAGPVAGGSFPGDGGRAGFGSQGQPATQRPIRVRG